MGLLKNGPSSASFVFKYLESACFNKGRCDSLAESSKSMLSVIKSVSKDLDARLAKIASLS